MPHFVRQLKHHVLIRHNPGEGTYPKTERCPNMEVFAKFCLVADGLRRAGLPVPSIRELFPEEYVGAAPEQEASSPPALTFDEWIGTQEVPGPFFHEAAAMTGGSVPKEGRMATYRRQLHTRGRHMVGRPMDDISEADAQRFADSYLVCEACQERAVAAGRADLTARPDLHLRAVDEPWDGDCTADGVSTHSVRYQLCTIDDYVRALRYAFKVAIWSGGGRRPRQPRLAAVNQNPFEHVVIEDFEERLTPIDFAFTLTHEEVKRALEATPPHFRAAIAVAVAGGPRRSELLGMCRSNLHMPPLDELDGQAVFSLTHVFVGGVLTTKAKTDKVIGHATVLPPWATKMLQEHIDTYMSTPDPDVCSACRDGLGPWQDQRARNPHRGCRLADDAPMWIDPTTGERPNADSFGRMFKRVAKKIGLGDGPYVPGLHTLRATTATQAIESGQSPAEVVEAFNWSSEKTIRRHYTRLTVQGRKAANMKIEAEVQAAWGGHVDAEAARDEQVRLLRIANDSLRAEVESLKRQLEGAPPPAPISFKSKGSYTKEDLARELGPAKHMTHLCKRLGLTGAMNTREAIRRKMDDAGLEFWPETDPEEAAGATGSPDLAADPHTAEPPEDDHGEAVGDEAA